VVAARGDVRRAKLYYLRGRIGKAARVAERRWGIDDDVVSAPKAAAAPVATDAEGVSQEEAEVVEAPPEADDAAAPEAGETEDNAAPEDAEDEKPADAAGDSDEDSAA
jgi:large subunit ribosomal protein L19